MMLHHINNSRDRKYGKPVEGKAIDVTEEADSNKKFRFIS